MSLGVRLVVGVDEILIQGSSYSPHLIPLISFLSSHSSRLISCHLISGDGRFEEIITGSPAGTVQYGTSITLWGNNLQAQVDMRYSREIASAFVDTYCVYSSAAVQ